MKLKKILYIVMITVLSVIGCGSSEIPENDGRLPELESMESDIDPVEQSDTVIMATAKNENDLTGTYEDKEMELKIIIIQKDELVTYNFCNSDGSEPFIETDCTIESGYISGQAYYISKNMDGSLAISGGAGGSWGQFVKISDDAIIDLAEMMGDNSTALAYDLSTDVENGMLYSDDSGCIVDSNGNIIPEYEYINVLDNGYISDGECVLEGYCVDTNGQIVSYIPGEVSYTETNSSNSSSLTEIIGLRSGEYKNPKSPVVITIPDEVYSTEATEIFVYVPIYIGTEDNKYEYEYSGMINLFDIGTITIMTGPQSSTWLKYDYEEGYISEATSLIYDSLGADYEIDGVTKFYIDGFAPDTVNFVGEVGTYFCEDVNGYAGRVYVNQITEESIEFDVSSLSWADNEYFVQGGYGKITDNNTAVYKGISSSITLQWDENGNIQLLVEGDLPYGSVKEQEAIESVIGQTFEFVSPEFVGW